MAAEFTGRAKFAKLVANHVLGDENWYVYLAVMDGKGFTYKLWCNRTATSPCFDDSAILLAKRSDFFREYTLSQKNRRLETVKNAFFDSL